MRDQNMYNFNAIKRIFDLEITRDAFYNLEKKEAIPQSKRKKENDSYRYWDIKDLAKIGPKFSILGPRKNKKDAIVTSIYLTKGGGSHKTTFCFNFSKFLALNGKKILLIPLDFQLNLSKKFNFDNSITNVKKTGKYYKGLFEAIDNDLPVNDVIFKTDFPNIDIIPESSNLVRLEVLINSKSFRESIIKQKIKDALKNYDIIIFDNNPSWDILALNSICASDVLISPIGIDSNSSDTLPIFLETLNKQLQGLKLKDIIFIPGFYENNILKKQILEAYRADYPSHFTRNEIRKSTSIDEALGRGLSIFEYDHKSQACDDYKKICHEVWSRIVNSVNRTEDIKQ